MSSPGQNNELINEGFFKIKTTCYLCYLMNDIIQITSLKCSILFRQMFWLTKAAHFCFSSCEADRCKHPWTQIHGFSSSSLARVLLWPQVVTRLTSDPKESKVRVQCVLHGQIQVQADRHNWFHMPKYITQQYQYHWTACLQKPGFCSIRRVALAHEEFV